MLSSQLQPEHTEDVVSLIHRHPQTNPLAEAIEHESVGESPAVETQIERLHDRVEKFEHIQQLREMQRDNFAIRAFKRLVRSAA